MPPARVVEACPAKVNLFLEVLGTRPDGYRDLATVMVPVSLAATLGLEQAVLRRAEGNAAGWLATHGLAKKARLAESLAAMAAS